MAKQSTLAGEAHEDSRDRPPLLHPQTSPASLLRLKVAPLVTRGLHRRSARRPSHIGSMAKQSTLAGEAHEDRRDRPPLLHPQTSPASLLRLRVAPLVTRGLHRHSARRPTHIGSMAKQSTSAGAAHEDRRDRPPLLHPQTSPASLLRLRVAPLITRGLHRRSARRPTHIGSMAKQSTLAGEAHEDSRGCGGGEKAQILQSANSPP